jgi:DNA-directed RNA polymerase specialized sigma24 family protein
MAKQPEPPHGQDDELILSIWEGDENAKAQIVVQFVPALERAISGQFRRLHSGEVEDVVAEAIRRFWARRATYDPARYRLDVCLYRTARQVACEYTAGRLKWQKARLLERPVGDKDLWLRADRESEELEVRLDILEADKPELVKALVEEFGKLSALEQDVWQAFADADGVELDSSQLGIEMGEKHNGGVPYTGVNIRVIKHRARAKLVTAMKARSFDLKKLGYGDE